MLWSVRSRAIQNKFGKFLAVAMALALTVQPFPVKKETSQNYLAPHSDLPATLPLPIQKRTPADKAGVLIGSLVAAGAVALAEKTNAAEPAQVASWRKAIDRGIQRAREANLPAIPMIDKYRNILPAVKPVAWIKTLTFQMGLGMAALIGGLTWLACYFRGGNERRRFFRYSLGSTAASLLAMTGCTVTQPDRVTEASLYPHEQANQKYPNNLNYSLGQFLDLALLQNLELKRIYFDYFRVTEVARRLEEGQGDFVLTASVSAIWGDSIVPYPAAGAFVTGDILYGNVNAAYQTHERFNDDGDQTSGPANLTAATIANDATGALNGINPEMYYTFNLMGSTSEASVRQRVPEAIRARFRHQLAKVTFDVTQAYWKVAQLNQNLRWLTQLKSVYEKQLALNENRETRQKLEAVETEIREINENHLPHAKLNLLDKAGFRRRHFNCDLTSVNVTPTQELDLAFDANALPLFDQDTVRQEMLRHSSDHVRLTELVSLTSQAITESKNSYNSPVVTLAAGYEPPTHGLFGLIAQLRPLRFRTAEGRLMNLRSWFLDRSANREQVEQSYEYKVARFFVDRTRYLGAVTRGQTAYTSSRSEAVSSIGQSTLTGLLQLSGADFTTEIGSFDADKLAKLESLLTNQREFLSALRVFNELEGSRFVLQGRQVSDSTSSRALNTIKQYYDQYMQQEPIWFHGLFSDALRSFIPWLLAAIGFGAAIAPGQALAETPGRLPGPPAIRWKAPQMAPMGFEPVYSTSL